ncbi:MAG: fumarylacetoacetate hydrolase family protein, partial [Vulcanimicrobiaceae bacterium]
MRAILGDLASDEEARDPLLAPIDPMQEVWASGVTYLRSREARKRESHAADVYERVYDAERPELFLKSIGWRVAGTDAAVRIRKDSAWNVPEPELVVAINRFGEIVGYTAGNDVSSRDIEGANPLYLPQAKIYNRSCSIG